MSQIGVKEWSDKQLGGCAGLTIASDGCFVTSVTMVFNYYQRDFTNPGKLNQQLTDGSNDCGYASDPNGRFPCQFRWCAPDKLGPSGLTWSGSDTNWSHVDRELSRGHPVLATVKNPPKTYGHMVVIVAKVGDSYLINDSMNANQSYVWSDQKHLDHGAFVGKGETYQLVQFIYIDGPKRPSLVT